MHVKDPYESKYQYFINKHQEAGQNHFSKDDAFIEYVNDMNVYKSTDDLNPGKQKFS